MRSNSKNEVTKSLVRVDKDGNVVFFFKDEDKADEVNNILNSMREENGEKKRSVIQHEELFDNYYLVTFSPEEYIKHYDNVRPYKSLVTHRNNAEQILERFQVFYNRLQLNSKKELSDITDLLRYEINNAFDLDSNVQLDISFRNYPEYIIAKLNTPEYYNMLMDGLKQNNVTQACIKFIQSLLAEDLDQHSMYLYQEKLNSLFNRPDATYSDENFEIARATKDPEISEIMKFTFHEENKKRRVNLNEDEKHVEQTVYLKKKTIEFILAACNAVTGSNLYFGL